MYTEVCCFFLNVHATVNQLSNKFNCIQITDYKQILRSNQYNLNSEMRRNERQTSTCPTALCSTSATEATGTSISTTFILFLLWHSSLSPAGIWPARFGGCTHLKGVNLSEVTDIRKEQEETSKDQWKDLCSDMALYSPVHEVVFCKHNCLKGISPNITVQYNQSISNSLWTLWL